jgi:chromosomal replication initiator protein
MKTPQEIWQAALGELQLQVSKPNYDTWLKDTEGIDFNDDLFTVRAPNTFVAEWLESRLLSLIKNTLGKLVGQMVEVQFYIHPTCQALPQKAAVQADGGISVKTRREHKFSKFNPGLTFDTFIAGDSNQMAYSAAWEVAQKPGEVYNPLYIYGDTGLGKTHLLQAIGNNMRARKQEVIYISAEQLTTEFVASIKNDTTESFNIKYRNTDVLLLDDFQFFSGKKQTQQCFFHLFNDLRDNDCQIVITCDCPPRAISAIGEKLRSRLEWGLVADIKSPDFDTRLAILNGKAGKMKVDMSPDVLEFIANHFRQNIRELEGGLTRVITYARAHKSPPTMDIATDALASLMPDDQQSLSIFTPRLIIEAVASYYNLHPDTLTGKSRDRKTTQARQIAMYLIQKQVGCSLSEIGKLFGGRDHSTVLYSCEKISSETNVNQQINSALNDICRDLKIHKVSTPL